MRPNGGSTQDAEKKNTEMLDDARYLIRERVDSAFNFRTTAPEY